MKKKKLYIVIIGIIIIVLLAFFCKFEKGTSFGSWGRNRTIDWK
jgi:uncharacterized protein YpmB